MMKFRIAEILVAMATFSVHGLSQGPAGLPAFEVASVRQSDPKLGMRSFPVRGGPGTSDPGQVVYTNLSLKYLLYYAYGAHADEITGPAWIGSEHYDVTAKIPQGTNTEQFTLMLRNLLAERFHLALHHESKQIEGYDLVVGRNGQKLKKSSEADSVTTGQPPSGPSLRDKADQDGYPQLARPGMIYPSITGSNGQAIHLVARAQTLSDLATILGGMFHHPIANKTGLDGRYDFTLEFALETINPVADAPVQLPPRIPIALQEQLGLKLEPVRVTVDMLVIDHADKVPTEN